MRKILHPVVITPIGFLIALSGMMPLSIAQQNNRIEIDGQPLFLNGGHIAWINFARDIGPGETRLDLFEDLFRTVNEHGSNTMRLWLPTTGASTPAWDGHTVTGPGENTIEDLRAILDLAHQNNVSLMLCLWSFDMLRIRNGAEVTERAYAILTDREKTQTWIDHYRKRLRHDARRQAFHCL